MNMPEQLHDVCRLSFYSFININKYYYECNRRWKLLKPKVNAKLPG